MRRRDLLASAGWLTAGTLSPPSLHAAVQRVESGWPGYRAATVIDGMSGVLAFSFDEGDPYVEADLAAIRRSGMTAVIDTVAPQGRFWLDDDARRRTDAAFAKRHAVIDARPDELLLVRSADDLVTAKSTGVLGVVLSFQGSEPIGEDLDRITDFRENGLRVVQLTHNRRNLVGDGSLEPGNAGLSRFGLQLVERLNDERLLIDLSHGSQRTIAEAILASSYPVLIGHTACRALADDPRNTGDDELRALADRGGVAGMIFWPYLTTGAQPTAHDLIRHIEHAINVCGEDHVGIGTDIPVLPVERTPESEAQQAQVIASLMQQGILAPGRPLPLYTYLPDLNHERRFEQVAALLASRGHDDRRIGKILGGNFARVMAEVWG